MASSHWKKGLLAAMDNDKYVDFQLIGTDEVKVPCVKFVLATQSEVFDKMFYGEFEERVSDQKTLGYHSSVIRVLVKYCHSGDVDLSYILSAEKEMSIAEIKHIVELRDAGRYYHIDSVFVRAEKEIGDAVFRAKKDSGHICLAVLTEMMTRGEDSGALWDVLFQFAVDKPMECFGRKSSAFANRPHPRVLRRVLDKISDTYLLVQCLQAWSLHESNDTETTGVEEEALVAISKRVDLKKLSAQQLSKVKPCSFFPSEKLHEACVHHLGRCQPEETSTTYFTTVELCVSGAGVSTTDGRYEHDGNTPDQYFKRGEYGNIPCKYTICFDFKDTKWGIYVTLEKKGKRQTFHLYQASPLSAGGIPFNGWKSAGGTDAAPIVATITKRKKSPPNNSSGFGFGGSGPFAAPAPVPFGWTPAPARQAAAGGFGARRL